MIIAPDSSKIHHNSTPTPLSNNPSNTNIQLPTHQNIMANSNITTEGVLLEGFAINQPPPVGSTNVLWNPNTVQSNTNTSANIIPNNNNSNPFALNINKQIESINIQQSNLREQILQSESNLTAQHQVNGVLFILLYFINLIVIFINQKKNELTIV